MDTGINNILVEGEQVVWEGKMNRKVIISTHIVALAIMMVIGWYLFGLNTISYRSEDGNLGQVSGQLIGGIIWLAGLFFVGTSYLGNVVTSYVITKKRIILKSGIIGTDFKSIYFDQIKNIIVEVGLVGKIFGTGSIKIDTGKIEISTSGGHGNNAGHATSKTAYDVLKNIDTPYDVYKYTQQSLEGRKESLYSGRADEESLVGMNR